MTTTSSEIPGKKHIAQEANAAASATASCSSGTKSSKKMAAGMNNRFRADLLKNPTACG